MNSSLHFCKLHSHLSLLLPPLASKFIMYDYDNLTVESQGFFKVFSIEIKPKSFHLINYIIHIVIKYFRLLSFNDRNLLELFITKINGQWHNSVL